MIKDKTRVTVIVEPFTEDEHGVETPVAGSVSTHRCTMTAPKEVDGKYKLPARLRVAAMHWLASGCPDPLEDPEKGDNHA